MSDYRPIDVTLFGATGFAGRLTAAHLYRRCREEGLTLALAGRNRQRLEELVHTLEAGTGQGRSDAPQYPRHRESGALLVRVASSDNNEELRRLASESRVVCSTVGPYALLGSPLVAACAEAGTDYCDLTGEVQWVRRMIDEHAARARRSGARIVHSCGFDSIPSDLGVHLAQERHRELHGEVASRLRLRLTRGEGGVSRGTLESMVNLVVEAKKSSLVRELLKDPRSLEEGWSPPGSGSSSRRWRDPVSGAWTLPFIMEEVNRRVVHRTNSLLGYPYGKDFEYRELFFLPKGPAGFLAALGGRIALALARPLLSFPPTRWLIQAVAFPKPGEGPKVALEGRGSFEACLEEPETGKVLVTISADRDPGYGATSIMLGESAILLAQTREKGAEGGVLTPAVALGAPLAGHLTAAGVRFGTGSD